MVDSFLRETGLPEICQEEEVGLPACDLGSTPSAAA
jgi:hypothetical protein